MPGKQITKLVRDSRHKVQAQVNGEKVRVIGENRADLQAIITILKEADLAAPLQSDRGEQERHP